MINGVVGSSFRLWLPVIFSSSKDHSTSYGGDLGFRRRRINEKDGSTVTSIEIEFQGLNQGLRRILSARRPKINDVIWFQLALTDHHRPPSTHLALMDFSTSQQMRDPEKNTTRRCSSGSKMRRRELDAVRPAHIDARRRRGVEMSPKS